MYCALLLAPMAWLWSALRDAREAARFSQCYGDFKGLPRVTQLSFGPYGSLPPAYLTDANGKPTLSWRVIILPFMEQDSLYKRFNLSEPWDSPTNIKLLAEMPMTYCCPNRYWDHTSGRTKCVAITGPGTMFPGPRSAKFDDVRDGLDGTIMLAEVENLDVPWTPAPGGPGHPHDEPAGQRPEKARGSPAHIREGRR